MENWNYNMIDFILLRVGRNIFGGCDVNCVFFDLILVFKIVWWLFSCGFEINYLNFMVWMSDFVLI